MRELYEKQMANVPRIGTDRFFADYENTYKYTGFMDEMFRYIEDFQLLKPELWSGSCSNFVRMQMERTRDGAGNPAGAGL